MAHTAGDWHVGPKLSNFTHCSICAWSNGPNSTRTLIANVINTEGNGDPSDNANLLASARVLLAACESLFDAMGQPLAFLPVVQAELLRAAIAKANGKVVSSQ